jgi:hypothetical protein
MTHELCYSQHFIVRYLGVRIMRIRIIVFGIVAAVTLAVTGIGLGTQSARAQFSGTEICGPYEVNVGYYPCINAWNGGPWEKVYSNGVTNDYFYVVGVDLCGNGDYSTSTCPLVGSLNIPNLFIYQIHYGNKYAGSYNNCVGDDGAKDGMTAFVTCSPAGYGSYFLAYHLNCPGGSNVGLNREWTDHDGAYRALGWSNDTYGWPIDNDYPYLSQCLYQFGG